MQMNVKYSKSSPVQSEINARFEWKLNLPRIYQFTNLHIFFALWINVILHSLAIFREFDWCNVIAICKLCEGWTRNSENLGLYSESKDCNWTTSVIKQENSHQWRIQKITEPPEIKDGLDIKAPGSRYLPSENDDMHKLQLQVAFNQGSRLNSERVMTVVRRKKRPELWPSIEDKNLPTFTALNSPRCGVNWHSLLLENRGFWPTWRALSFLYVLRLGTIQQTVKKHLWQSKDTYMFYEFGDLPGTHFWRLWPILPFWKYMIRLIQSME